jgi:hypothetical protein
MGKEYNIVNRLLLIEQQNNSLDKDLRGAGMPEISLFYGIRITMNWDEHNPPHFHVRYAEHNATVLIQECIIDRGYLPNKQLKLALAWCEIHKEELMQNWELARDSKPLNEIQPLV